MDAAIDLVVELDRVPTVDQIARRAEVSVASIFRYFDSVDELHRQTAARYYDRYHELFILPDPDDLDLGRRIAILVDARIALWSEVGPMARLARARAYDSSSLDELLRGVRSDLAASVRTFLAAELDDLDPVVADRAVTAISFATSYEAWSHSHLDAALPTEENRSAWLDLVGRCQR